MNKKEINQWIEYERNLIYGNLDLKGRLKYAVTENHLIDIAKYQKYLRLEYYYRKRSGIYKIAEMWYCRKKNKLGNRLGFYMDCEVFDKGLLIYHHGSIIVNGFARVGRDCKLHGNNCIGNNGTSLKAPRIGNNVDIGFGAIIIGDVTLADNITVGAGAVVVNSFTEKGITIGGVPAKKIK